MFWKEKYPVSTETNNQRQASDDDEDHENYDCVFSERSVDESILSFLKSDEEEDDEKVGDSILDDATASKKGDDQNDRDDISSAPSSIVSPHNDNTRDRTSKFSFSSSCTRLNSNILFLFGASIYVWTSYYVYDYFSQSGTDPRRDITLPQEGDNDDYEFLFQANSKSTSSYVSLYMAFSFAANLSWAVQGLWNTCFASSKCHFRLHAILWTLAALCGMSSSALLLKDQFLSEIFHSVSVHLFAIAALTMICMPKPTTLQGVKCCLPCCCCCTPVRWLRLADCFLILGTLGDVILSYFGFWKEDIEENTDIQPFHLLYGAMATAGCWGLCAVIYVIISIAEIWCLGSQPCHDEQNDNKDLPQNEDKDEDVNDEESQGSKHQKYLPERASLTRGPTDDTANDDGSITSFSSWWTAGPATKEDIAKSSLDNIFGR
jgi:hypothetical protein